MSWSHLEGKVGVGPVGASGLVEMAFQTKHVVVTDCVVLGKGLGVGCGRDVGAGARWADE